MEATAVQTREVADAMQKVSRVAVKALTVDGGMVANELRNNWAVERTFGWMEVEA